MIIENDLVVGIGEALWDILPKAKKIGGAPANFAFHVSQFGLPGCVVSAVGDDNLGIELIEDFTSKNLNQLINLVPYPTGTVRVEIDDDGQPRYDIKENVAWDNIPFSPELKDLASRTKAICFGTLAQRNIVSRSTINEFLDAMLQDDDTLVVFDVNLRQSFFSKDILMNSLERCNILKINNEELEIICMIFGYPDIDFQESCRILLEKYNLRILILTCGTDGSYVFTTGHMFFQPTPIVKVADTVGAGDSFTAAFIASLLKGKIVEEAHRIAVETSAFVCSHNGAMPKLPERLTKA